MGTNRDYYADLELPPSADVQDIKKQFRKLALKYHPDRNPGKEQECNVKFQIIQHAQEVLTDPEQKAKYDATRSQSRYTGGGSGVRGNPWSNVSSQYPPPPRRNASSRPTPSPRPTPSGAQRWQTRFAPGMPPTAKQSTASDSETKKNAARAFENMRKGPAPAPAREHRPPPPPPPPRTESARQRAEASFGARKSGFHPRSAAPGDEPPVTNHNYTSRPSSERYAQYTQDAGQSSSTPMPDPLGQFRDPDSFADPRQSTPYQTHGGEKTDPFDGTPISRARSSDKFSRQDGTSSSSDDGPSARQRSASVPQGKEKEPMTDPNTPEKGQRRKPVPEPWENRPKATPKSRVGSKRANNPNANRNPSSDSPIPEATEPATNESSTNFPNNTTGGPSMYASPPCSQHKQSSPSLSACKTCGTYHIYELRSIWAACQSYDATRKYATHGGSPLNPTPSGGKGSRSQLTPFELQQHRFLARLIDNGRAATKENAHETSTSDNLVSPGCADKPFSNSFNFDVNDDTFVRSSPARSSTDDINTSFVDEDTAAWQFNAGAEEDGLPHSRSQTGSQTGRRSPSKRPAMHRTDSPNVPSEAEESAAGFNPEGWSDKFGPQTFFPQPSQTKPPSPTRSSRASSKKPKPKHMKTAGGNATVIDDSSSEDEVLEWRGRKAQGDISPSDLVQPEPVAAESPQAMDIDSSPAASAAPSPQPLNGARKIHVEPSRPEWRPGHVEDVNGDTKLASAGTKEPHPNTVGSEDSEEFRANFSDFKNVAPFTQESSGLKSFTDLKDTLPFESKPSAQLPVKLPKPPPLVFPNAPSAPRLPPIVAVGKQKPNKASWDGYVKEFESYLQRWDAFNAQVVDHFATRKANIARIREDKGYTFLESRSDTDVQEYYNWVQQDMDVRKRWCAACEEHEQRIREFMVFKQKMK
ncbi:hypothetical protein G7046_g6065 [Stylonectria norvegica]|nr:hypothetical protein G7046_g6065 [Stylonectria norvegica]